MKAKEKPRKVVPERRLKELHDAWLAADRSAWHANLKARGKAKGNAAAFPIPANWAKGTALWRSHAEAFIARCREYLALVLEHEAPAKEATVDGASFGHPAATLLRLAVALDHEIAKKRSSDLGQMRSHSARRENTVARRADKSEMVKLFKRAHLDALAKEGRLSHLALRKQIAGASRFTDRDLRAVKSSDYR